MAYVTDLPPYRRVTVPNQGTIRFRTVTKLAIEAQREITAHVKLRHSPTYTIPYSHRILHLNCVEGKDPRTLIFDFWGPTLLEVLQEKLKNSQISAKAFCEITKQILEGYSCIEASSMTHGAVSLKNVLVQANYKDLQVSENDGPVFVAIKLANFSEANMWPTPFMRLGERRQVAQLIEDFSGYCQLEQYQRNLLNLLLRTLVEDSAPISGCLFQPIFMTSNEVINFLFFIDQVHGTKQSALNDELDRLQNQFGIVDWMISFDGAMRRYSGN